tara:strand:+ start:155 stop:538 length:384 start_codon:yes stop_codon:yes gene_type:complete
MDIEILEHELRSAKDELVLAKKGVSRLSVKLATEALEKARARMPLDIHFYDEIDGSECGVHVISCKSGENYTGSIQRLESPLSDEEMEYLITDLNGRGWPELERVITKFEKTWIESKIRGGDYAGRN